MYLFFCDDVNKCYCTLIAYTFGRMKYFKFKDHVSAVPRDCVRGSGADTDCIRKYIVDNLGYVRAVFLKAVEKCLPHLALITAPPFTDNDLASLGYVFTRCSAFDAVVKPRGLLYGIYIKGLEALAKTGLGRALCFEALYKVKKKPIPALLEALLLDVLELADLSAADIKMYFEAKADIALARESAFTEGDLLLFFEVE